MTIQVCSDLHLELKENREWFKKHPIIPKGDILIIAGDTYFLNRNYAKLDFIKQASQDFKEVFLIPGNHEFYGGYDAAYALYPIVKNVAPNVTLLNNTSLQIEDYTFIFSTMWSHISKQMYEVINGMIDFRNIIYKGGQFYMHHFNKLHKKSFEFISDEVQKKGKKVVVTHHLPSTQCHLPEFKGNLLSEAFCADKTDFISNNNIQYWIYGHSHGNQRDFEISGTKMVTNQFGYIHSEEHHDFNYEKTLVLT